MSLLDRINQLFRKKYIEHNPRQIFMTPWSIIILGPASAIQRQGKLLIWTWVSDRLAVQWPHQSKHGIQMGILQGRRTVLPRPTEASSINLISKDFVPGAKIESVVHGPVHREGERELCERTEQPDQPGHSTNPNSSQHELQSNLQRTNPLYNRPLPPTPHQSSMMNLHSEQTGWRFVRCEPQIRSWASVQR